MGNIEHIASLNMILVAVAIMMISLLHYAKQILLVYRILIFFIGYNLVLTMISPEISVLNVLADNSKIDDWAIRGQIGDLLAGHFTALALIALVINISQMQNSLSKQDESLKMQKEEMKLQREEMKLQREEMKLQRKEMKDSAESLKLQSKLYEKQNFENTFFQMLKLYVDLVNAMEYEDKNKKIYTKKSAIQKYHFDFMAKLYELKDENINFDLFVKTYTTFMSINHINFDHYFRTIYRILKYVDTYKDEYDQIDKNLYINILRAQFTSLELNFIFSNALTRNGIKSKNFIEKYSLLKHLTSFTLYEIFNVEIIKRYDIKAFGDGYFSKIEHQEYSFNNENTVSEVVSK